MRGGSQKLVRMTGWITVVATAGLAVYYAIQGLWWRTLLWGALSLSVAVLDSLGQAPPSRVTGRLVLGLLLSLATIAGLVGAVTLEK